MFKECFFCFDGRSSREFELYIAYQPNDSTTRFGINRRSNIEIIPRSHKTYNLGSQLSPLTIPVKIFSTKPLNRQKRIEICRWLFKDDFMELYSEHEPEVIYYCKIQGDSSRFIAEDDTGFLEVDLVCDAPFAWSKPMIHRINLRDDVVPPLDMPVEFQIRNDSNYNNWYDFIVKIRIPEGIPPGGLGALSFTMWNKTNTPNREDAFVISSALGNFPLQREEFLQIDMVTGNIYTDASIGGSSTSPRYSHRRRNCNKKFITLDRGINRIEFTGRCLLETTLQVPVLM